MAEVLSPSERLSPTERRIMTELLYNSRQPLSSLAKKMRMSKQLVAYKIKKLVEKGYIKGFITVVDWNRIGYIRGTVNLKLLPMSKQQEEKVLKAILSLGITVLFKCEVEWDLIVGIVAKNIQEFAEKIALLKQILKEKLTNLTCLIHLSSITLCPVTIWEEIGESKIVTYLGPQKKCEEIDGKDRLILSAISINAKDSYMELSKMTGLPPETIRYRLKLLEKRKIIAGYTVSLDPNLENLHLNRIFLSLNMPSEENIKKVTTFLLNLKQIRRVIRVMPDYDIAYDIRVNGGKELRKVKMEVASHVY